jgi:acyl-CoA thioesterase FadM
LGTKLRSFISPGDTLELETRLSERSGESATLTVETRKENRVVGSARVVLASVEPS